MKSLTTYIEEAVKAGASDVHLIGGEKPMMRIAGELQPLDADALPAKELEKEIVDLLTPAQEKTFRDEMELDVSTVIAHTRFRVNLHLEDGRVGMAARLIPKDIPSPKDLDFSPVMQELTNLLDGLVLVVGPTGSGKSTTIASMIEDINKRRKAHIVTIEDPIEFVFEDKMSLIEQREVGIDTKSFPTALKHVLRQDPNVILVGEMRDPETIATVLTAAETGHLVFSTLHTGTAAEAVERIVDVFDGAKQRQALIQLAAVLRAVVAQELVPGTDGKMVVVREILVNTPAVSNLIRENNIAQLKSAIQTGAKDGMMSFENAMKALVQDGRVSEETMEKRMGRQKRV